MQSLEEKIAQLTGDVYSTFLAKGRQLYQDNPCQEVYPAAVHATAQIVVAYINSAAAQKEG